MQRLNQWMPVSQRLSASLNAVVTMTRGIHMDDIPPDELAGIPRLAGQLVNEALERLSA